MEEAIKTTEELLDMQSSATMVGNPVFEKNTPAVIIAAEVKIFDEIKMDKVLSKSYREASLKVTYNTSPDIPAFQEKYGGIKCYEVDGKLAVKVGEKSAAGSMLSLLELNGINWNGLLKDLPKLIIGKKVKLMTETYTINGEVYKKNLPKDISE